MMKGRTTMIGKRGSSGDIFGPATIIIIRREEGGGGEELYIYRQTVTRVFEITYKVVTKA